MVATAFALLLVGFVISAPLTELLIRLGRRLGTLDSPGSAGHRKALRHVPNIGGIAIVAAVALPLFIVLVLVSTSQTEFLLHVRPMLEHYLGRMQESAPVGWGLLAGLVVIHLLGMIDDRRALRPVFKLAVEFGVAAALVVLLDVRLLTMLDNWGALGYVASALLSILWIVTVTNAMNFLDNMDGLAAGVALIAGSLFMAAALIVDQWFIAGVLALLVGGLAGFLPFNFPPRGTARIFMGDGGSLSIGFLLAVMTIRTTFVELENPRYALGSAWYCLFMPIVILAVPLYDLVAVSILRISQGRSPLVGDQQHLSHRLVDRGLSRRQAVLVIWALTFITGVGGVILGSVRPWQAALIGVQVVATLLVLGLLERTVRK